MTVEALRRHRPETLGDLLETLRPRTPGRRVPDPARPGGGRGRRHRDAADRLREGRLDPRRTCPARLAPPGRDEPRAGRPPTVRPDRPPRGRARSRRRRRPGRGRCHAGRPARRDRRPAAPDARGRRPALLRRPVASTRSRRRWARARTRSRRSSRRRSTACASTSPSRSAPASGRPAMHDRRLEDQLRNVLRAEATAPLPITAAELERRLAGAVGASAAGRWPSSRPPWRSSPWPRSRPSSGWLRLSRRIGGDADRSQTRGHAAGAGATSLDRLRRRTVASSSVGPAEPRRPDVSAAPDASPRPSRSGAQATGPFVIGVACLGHGDARRDPNAAIRCPVHAGRGAMRRKPVPPSTSRPPIDPTSTADAVTLSSTRARRWRRRGRRVPDRARRRRIRADRLADGWTLVSNDGRGTCSASPETGGRRHDARRRHARRCSSSARATARSPSDRRVGATRSTARSGRTRRSNTPSRGRLPIGVVAKRRRSVRRSSRPMPRSHDLSDRRRRCRPDVARCRTWRRDRTSSASARSARTSRRSSSSRAPPRRPAGDLCRSVFDRRAVGARLDLAVDRQRRGRCRAVATVAPPPSSSTAGSTATTSGLLRHRRRSSASSSIGSSRTAPTTGSSPRSTRDPTSVHCGASPSTIPSSRSTRAMRAAAARRTIVMPRPAPFARTATATDLPIFGIARRRPSSAPASRVHRQNRDGVRRRLPRSTASRSRSWPRATRRPSGDVVVATRCGRSRARRPSIEADRSPGIIDVATAGRASDPAECGGS